MPGPMEKTRAGGNRQLENESPAAADPLLQDIAKMKKLQADIEAKALLEIFRNRSPVREDHLALPLLRLPLLSPLRIPQEFLPTRPPVAPPRVRTLDPFDDPERDSILHKPLFVSDESDSDDMTENNDTADKNGNSDSDLSDTNIYRPKKRAREKSSARKTNAKKGKPSAPEYFVETKLFTCKLCNQVFTSKRGFNIHKTRIHNEIIATEVASVSADRRKGTEKKKTNANQRKRPEKKKNANQPKVEVNINVNNTANYNLLGRPLF